jgi:hypothetical protein
LICKTGKEQVEKIIYVMVRRGRGSMRVGLSAMLVLLCILSVEVTQIEAQAAQYPPMAAFGTDGNIWLYGLEDEPIQITHDASDLTRILWSSGGTIHDLVWSPDGTWLAFVPSDNILRLYGLGSGQITDLDIRILQQVPMNFDASGHYLLYPVVGDEVEGENIWTVYEINIERVPLDANAVSEQIATVGVMRGVHGGGPINPAEWIYLTEMGGLWRPGDRILVETAFGLLSSSDDFDQDGIRLHVAIEGAGVGLTPIFNAVISSDRTQIATVDDENITLIHLATQEESVLETEHTPEMVAWGANEDIFYTSVNYGPDFRDEMTDEEREILLEQNDYILDMGSLTSNIAAIHRIDIASGLEETIYQTEAYGIGRLMPAPNGREVFFTTIPNIDTWLDMILNGELAGCDFECQLQLFQPSLYRLDLENGEAELIGTGLYKTTINFPVYESINS